MNWDHEFIRKFGGSSYTPTLCELPIMPVIEAKSRTYKKQKRGKIYWEEGGTKKGISSWEMRCYSLLN